MPKFKIEIDCGNAAFDGDCAAALARILRNVSADLVTWSVTPNKTCAIRDANGNACGFYRHETDDAPKR